MRNFLNFTAVLKVGIMSKKGRQGVVYSTDPDYRYEYDAPAETETPEAGKQELRVWLERKAGSKVVTAVKGFLGRDSDREALAKQLKNLCGSGGAVKDGEILVQGDHRDKVLGWLLEKGSRARKSGG